MESPRVFILILNWNGWHDTIQCLESIFRLSYSNYRVVVLDNASEDDSVAQIRNWVERQETASDPERSASRTRPKAVVFHDKGSAESFMFRDEENRFERLHIPYVVLIRTGANRGFAGGNNIGIRYALSRKADYILLLNNDALFRTPGALSLMIGFMERNPYAGACGGRLFYPDGRPQQSYGHFPSVLRTLAYLFPLYKLFPVRWFARVKRSNVVPDDAVRTPVRIDWPSGACLLARSSMIQGIGMLDERYFLYMEETDWCLRMKSCGWERYYLPGAELVHRFGGSPGNAGSAMLLRHLESLFIYYRTHFSRAARILVSAGYLVRAAWSTSFSTARHSVFSGHQKARADESARYWLLALRLSTDEFKNLVLDTLSSTKRAQRKGTARKRPA